MPPSSYRRLPVTSCGSCRNRFVPLPVLGTEFRFRLPRLQPPGRFLDQRGSQLTNRSGEASKQSALRREVVAAPLEAVPAARLASALRAAENLGSRWEAANSRIGGSRHTESHSSRSMGSHSSATGSRADSHTHSIHSSQQAATDPYRGNRRSHREAGRLQVPRYNACPRRSTSVSRLIERNCHSKSLAPPRQPNRPATSRADQCRNTAGDPAGQRIIQVLSQQGNEHVSPVHDVSVLVASQVVMRVI
jgi:hypothetical protein